MHSARQLQGSRTSVGYPTHPTHQPPSKMGSNAGGFSFDLVGRNSVLEQKGVKPPGFTKTGTTIVGLVFKVGGCTIGMIVRSLREP